MKKLLCILVVLAIVSIAQAVPEWQDDMSTVSNWSQGSNAANEYDSPESGGIRNTPSGGPYTVVQMNSWWDGAGWTSIWQNTNLVIQDETSYDIIVTMQSYASSASVSIKLSSIDNTNTWTDFQATPIAPATGAMTDYVVSFDTLGSNNDAILGTDLGIGVAAGWWNNLGIDNVAVWTPEPATIALLGFGAIAAMRRRKK